MKRLNCGQKELSLSKKILKLRTILRLRTDDFKYDCR